MMRLLRPRDVDHDSDRLRRRRCQCNKPKTATPAALPTNTLPSATVGVMNLLPAPKLSRLPGAWLLLYSSWVRFDASYACSTAGLEFSCAHTMAFNVPFADTTGAVPG